MPHVGRGVEVVAGEQEMKVLVPRIADYAIL